jgi:hypothetical protein
MAADPSTLTPELEELAEEMKTFLDEEWFTDLSSPFTQLCNMFFDWAAAFFNCTIVIVNTKKCLVPQPPTSNMTGTGSILSVHPCTPLYVASRLRRPAHLTMCIMHTLYSSNGQTGHYEVRVYFVYFVFTLCLLCVYFVFTLFTLCLLCLLCVYSLRMNTLLQVLWPCGMDYNSIQYPTMKDYPFAATESFCPDVPDMSKCALCVQLCVHFILTHTYLLWCRPPPATPPADVVFPVQLRV